MRSSIFAGYSPSMSIKQQSAVVDGRDTFRWSSWLLRCVHCEANMRQVAIIIWTMIALATTLANCLHYRELEIILLLQNAQHYDYWPFCSMKWPSLVWRMPFYISIMAIGSDHEPASNMYEPASKSWAGLFTVTVSPWCHMTVCVIVTRGQPPLTHINTQRMLNMPTI